MARSAGVLLSITSLPSPYGIGTIGKEARKFADFLKKSGQTVWQILPVGPTSYGDSPYQSFSTYAGNPYLIDLDTLIEEGLITKELVDSCDWCWSEQVVDYERIYNSRFKVLRAAYETFKAKDSKSREKRKYRSFVRKNSTWLKNYALYMAVKSSFDMVSWTEWPEDIKMREVAAVRRYERKLRDDVNFWKFLQFKFYEQWESFRAYVNGLGIKILGDMPIYVAMDSADTWANPELFQLYDDGDPIAVAGCPPDYFSETGQLWGNPLYDWDYLEQTDYEWWFERVKAASKLYDITRIDHFRAFASYYSHHEDRPLPRLCQLLLDTLSRRKRHQRQVGRGSAHQVLPDDGGGVRQIRDRCRGSGNPDARRHRAYGADGLSGHEGAGIRV